MGVSAIVRDFPDFAQVDGQTHHGKADIVAFWRPGEISEKPGKCRDFVGFGSVRFRNQQVFVIGYG